MEKMIITDEMYIEFIKNAIKTDGIKVTDTANKLALEMGAISLDQYLQAAHILVDAYFAQ